MILDASITGVWLFDDELDPRADVAMTRLEDGMALVPQLWHVEVRSVLLVAERRGRIRAGEVDERLLWLGGLPIQTDAQPDLDTALSLSRTHGLSFYDAVYLELAQRRQATLATLDAALGRAATAEGLMLVE
jgi:predicted nucleic acid-binding protein